MQLIPAIDLRGGNVVRLLHGEFDAETQYPLTAARLHERYREAGASWLHVVDLDGARDGQPAHLAVLRELVALGGLKLQSGGGLRSDAAVSTLFAAGIARAVIGSLAITASDVVARWLETYGPERIVVALDVRIAADGTPECAIHGWREQSRVTLWQAVEQLLGAGLRHVLCTDVSRDGALGGPNLGLYGEAVRRYPQVAWQASGGVRDATDLHALADSGVAAAVSGKALLEGRISDEELRPFLPAA